ncbi:MAG: type transporter [Firmicutes bacterium]|nr:type transporter [Bacillota bacterium]
MIRHIRTVFWRDWIVLKRRLTRYILSRTVSPILYLIAFGWGIGRAIPMKQGNYLDFIVPGIIALNSMIISFNAVGPPLNMSRIYHKTLEEYLLAPISASSYIIGKILSGVLRGLISSVVIIILSLLFGTHLQMNIWFILALVLNCAIFSALGIVAALYMNSHEDMSNFNTYVLTPMSFLCATFFLPSQLPFIMQKVIEILPLTQASYALRQSSLTGELPGTAIIIMLVYLVVLICIGINKMNRLQE